MPGLFDDLIDKVIGAAREAVAEKVRGFVGDASEAGEAIADALQGKDGPSDVAERIRERCKHTATVSTAAKTQRCLLCGVELNDRREVVDRSKPPVTMVDTEATEAPASEPRRTYRLDPYSQLADED